MPELAGLGLREALWLAAGLVAIYLVLLLLRLRRIPPPVPQQGVPGRFEPAMSLAPTPQAGPAGEPEASAFAQELAQSSAGLEVQRLRREVAQLRGEISRLGDELAQLKATQCISPLYSEALNMAQHGELPSGIAARCGISIGEAELVVALGRKEFRAAVANELAAASEGAGDGQGGAWSSRTTTQR